MKASTTYDTKGLSKALNGLIKYVDKSVKQVVATSVAKQAKISFDEVEVIPVVSGNTGTIVIAADDSTVEDELAALASNTLNSVEDTLTDKIKEAVT